MKSCRECVHGEPIGLFDFVNCHYPIPTWVVKRWGVELKHIRLDPMNAEHCPTYQPREEREP